MTLFKGRSQDDISLFFTAFLKSCSYLRSQAQQLQKKWKEKSGLVWNLWRAAKKNCFLRSYAVNLIINCFKKSFLRSWDRVQNIEAFICDIFLVVFIFKKASKTEFCIDGQYNSVCNFPFFFLSWERAWVENFVVLESPWTKIGKIWDRNKIPPQDVLHLLVKGKNMNLWNEIHGVLGIEKNGIWIRILFFCCWLIAISISGGVSLVHYYAKPTFPRMARMERASSEQGQLGKH